MARLAACEADAARELARVSCAEPAGLDAALATAAEALRRDGAVVLDDVYDPARLADLLDYLGRAYPDYAKPNRQLHYGPHPGRHTVGLTLDGPLGDFDLLLPHPLKVLARRLLGLEFVFDSVGLLVATAGSSDQNRHPDGNLFPEAAVDGLLPMFALAVAAPLVRMDEVSGRTAFWLGSHRRTEVSGPWDAAATVDPGSLVLWDFRTHHAGLANRGHAPRPVLYSVLSRHWWHEIHPEQATGYVPMAMPRDAFERLTLRQQYRLRRAALR